MTKTMPAAVLALVSVVLWSAETQAVEQSYSYRNGSSQELRGVMQNVGIIHLARGQEAKITPNVSLPFFGTSADGGHELNFIHLNEGTVYCTWRTSIRYTRETIVGSWGADCTITYMDPDSKCMAREPHFDGQKCVFEFWRN